MSDPSGPGPGVRILAGAPAQDRTRVAAPGSSTRWFEPMHVREHGRVRDEMTEQVLAGADVLVAPAWLTHRRALIPVGETRRVDEWTRLAVQVAREAAEMARERRDDGRVTTILGVLPDPTAIDEEATGRQPRPDAAAERDERAQAGVLADAGVDGVLVEARPSLDRSRVALRAVAEHGLPAWLVVPPMRPDGAPLNAWLDTLTADGVAIVLLDPGDVAAPGTASTEPTPQANHGILAPGQMVAPDPVAQARAWIERGASVLGIAHGATPGALSPLVDARNESRAATDADAILERAAIAAWIGDAARRASGGRAVWIGDAPTVALPDGFDWTTVPPQDIRRLPPASWRLLVALGPIAPADAARLVERGGIVAGTAEDADVLPAHARAAGFRLDDLAWVAGATRFIGRRDD